jgi:hypothetical protein
VAQKLVRLVARMAKALPPHVLHLRHAVAMLLIAQSGVDPLTTDLAVRKAHLVTFTNVGLGVAEESDFPKDDPIDKMVHRAPMLVFGKVRGIEFLASCRSYVAVQGRWRK